MEDKLLFCNETSITDTNYKSMMFYNKFFSYKYITITKLALCIFVIVGSTILLDTKLVYKVICILASICGIIDTFEVKDIRPEFITVLKYEFFDKYFEINNSKTSFKVPYDSIKWIIDTKENYYVVIDRSLLLMSKEGFTIGNREEIINFICEKCNKSR